VSPRRKTRANGRTGLWQDTPTEAYVPAHDLRIEQETSPLLRECPACHAAPRQRCTSPSRRGGGRRNLKGYHPSRKENP
jgi:hypothetical protein